MAFFDPYIYSDKELSDRISRMIPSPEGIAFGEALLVSLLEHIDLTSLNATDDVGSIQGLCDKAINFKFQGRFVYPAAVCVYSPFVRVARKSLSGNPVSIASVGGLFPSGKGPLKLKKDEIQYILDEGADEIDIVIDRGKMLSGRDEEVQDEIYAIRELCGERVLLKVILETGELCTVEMIRRASEIAIIAGADFIKTSTGKIQPAATHTATLIMLDTIAEYHRKTGKRIGIKPAGGISDTATALQYYSLVEKTLGPEWLTKEYFRFGTSRLWDDIITKLNVT